MAYITIKKEGEGEYEEKKSIFIGNVKRVANEEEARDYISYIKKKHKEARHHVYAYVIGENMGIQRYSDDGEPQGTGGVPVLEVIKKSEIVDCVVVVTRYFGGTLLGASGLIRAYSKAASLSIQDAGTVEKVEGLKLSIIIDYDILGKIQYIFEENNWYIEEIEYTDKVTLNLFCDLNNKEIIEKKVIDITSANCIINEGEKEVFFKEGSRLLKKI